MTREELISNLYDIAIVEAGKLDYDRVVVQFKTILPHRADTNWAFPLYVSIDDLAKNKEEYLQNPDMMRLEFFNKTESNAGTMLLDCCKKDNKELNANDITLSVNKRQNIGFYNDSVEIRFSDAIINKVPGGKPYATFTDNYYVVGNSYTGVDGERILCDLMNEIDGIFYENEHQNNDFDEIIFE